jgi:hypothetical protein
MAFNVRNAIAGLSAREKKMAAGMVAAMVLFAVALVAFFVRTAISDIEEENELREQTLRYVAVAGPKFQEKLAEQADQMQGTDKPPPLQTLVDGTVKKIEMPVPDTKELPDQSRDAWEEHGVEVSWHEVSLLQLTRFMEEVEGNKRRYPVAITRLEIRKLRQGEDVFDVTMAISTFEKLEETELAPGGDKLSKIKAAAKQGGR